MQECVSDKLVKRVAVSRATTGELIAAVTGKAIRVVGGCLFVASSVTVRLDSASTGLTGAMSMIVGVPLRLANDVGEIQTVAGEALNVTLGTGVQISGWLLYQEIGT